jgi:hypothetical protein
MVVASNWSAGKLRLLRANFLGDFCTDWDRISSACFASKLYKHEATSLRNFDHTEWRILDSRNNKFGAVCS